MRQPILEGAELKHQSLYERRARDPFAPRSNRKARPATYLEVDSMLQSRSFQNAVTLLVELKVEERLKELGIQHAND